LTEPHGFERLEKRHGTKLDKQARLRARAFLNQARQYYGAIAEIEPVAKPLLGYYFALNLTKVFLTVSDPPSTSSGSLQHGLAQAYRPGVNYSFKRERFKIQRRGVFRLLAERTGMKHCWAANYEMGLHELMPYLPDAYSLYADTYGQAPRLLPVEGVQLLFGSGKTAWLRVDVSRAVLQQRQISAARLLDQARVFGSRFTFVHSGDDEGTNSYELSTPVIYGQKRSEVLQILSQTFDECLLGCDRSFPGARRFLVLSRQSQLLSHEAITFAVLHHLSNVVRYRPGDAERILVSPHAWLLTSWVDRAVEGMLLNLATRITREEHVLI
jgi:hypothetical protein